VFDLVYWFFVFELGGGVLFDFGVYLILFVFMVFGMLLWIIVMLVLMFIGVDV